MTKRGLFEEADGGTIFLDEIGDISLALQAKLLRFLQNREFIRVGETVVRCVDVRVIVATNRDLEAAIERGDFRSDLYYRLNVITIHLPHSGSVRAIYRFWLSTSPGNLRLSVLRVRFLFLLKLWTH